MKFCLQEFNSRQPVRMGERDAVANLFPPPTANQSWRKVLSMGNLLNGHEPISREIIFSVNDRVSDAHYGSINPAATAGEIETHRMYIHGTSNDLWIALSVTSWDWMAISQNKPGSRVPIWCLSACDGLVMVHVLSLQERNQLIRSLWRKTT